MVSSLSRLGIYSFSRRDVEPIGMKLFHIPARLHYAAIGLYICCYVFPKLARP